MNDPGIDGLRMLRLMIHYDLPSTMEKYLNSIGRSGRYGRNGAAINFVTDDTRSQIKKIEQHFNIEMPDLPQDISQI